MYLKDFIPQSKSLNTFFVVSSKAVRHKDRDFWVFDVPFETVLVLIWIQALRNPAKKYVH